MIRHPSENFIKYLMTSGHPNQDQNEWIQFMVVQGFGFPSPQPDYLNWLRTDLTTKKPADFDPSNRYHTASRRFMRQEGILGMHSRDKSVLEANQIVLNIRIRPVLESLILGRLEPKDIAKKINSKMGTFYTSDGIDAYRHYYWQVNILRVEDWTVLLEQYEVQRQNVLAITQVGASMALHKHGFQQAIDSKSMLRTIQESLFFDFQEWKTKRHGSERTKAMTNLAKAAVLVDTQLSQADSAMKDSLKAFEQFRMETAKQAVPDVHELAPGGNYSGSGAKLLDTVSTDEETS